jgi:integrase
MGDGADRGRGSIRVRGGSLQVRVFVGRDAVTGWDRYLSRTIRGTDRAARREAEKIMTRLIAGERCPTNRRGVHFTG